MKYTGCVISFKYIISLLLLVREKSHNEYMYWHGLILCNFLRCFSSGITIFISIYKMCGSVFFFCGESCNRVLYTNQISALFCILTIRWAHFGKIWYLVFVKVVPRTLISRSIKAAFSDKLEKELDWLGQILS